MPVGILVATQHAAFGELIRISLEDNGQYNVRLVFSSKEARQLASQGSFQIAILDSALNDEPFIPFCSEIQNLQKGIRLIVIPPENNPNHPSLGDFRPHGFINRPFYLPDLIQTVERLVEEQKNELSAYTVPNVNIPTWLQDPRIIQAYLEKEMASTQAIFGIITRFSLGSNDDDLRVQTGQLSDAAAGEFSAIIFRYWNREEKTDLMRFIRLVSDKKDYLVYATQMVGDFILILAYSATSPLSQIRPQTKSVASRISTSPPEDLVLEKVLSFEASQPVIPPQVQLQEVVPSPSDNGHAPGASSDGVPEMPILKNDSQPLDDESFVSRLQSAFGPISEAEESEELTNEEVPNLSALLGAIPEPNASIRPPVSAQKDASSQPSPKPLYEPMEIWKDWQLAPEAIEEKQEAGEDKTDLFDSSYQEPANIPELASQDNENLLEKSINLDQTKATSLAASTLSFSPQELTLPTNLAPVQEAAINPLEDTRPHVVASLTSLGQLEPISPALSQITYTCILLPRIPYHYLTGELADRLAQWIHQLCLAFGWRLEAISLRPEYLQWTVQVAPSISPGNVVRIIRQKTSVYIFSQFTQIREQNPSGDFWAYGYLIVSGSQSPSSQLLREYISQTRKRQGVIK
jgi:REP element-mobilizing transposase RayT/DNA-binding NarL/FixJ family response regulator